MKIASGVLRNAQQQQTGSERGEATVDKEGGDTSLVQVILYSSRPLSGVVKSKSK